MRVVHLGLGNFFRAHQAWYTDRATDAADWGIAAFSGRSSLLSSTLEAQDGLYTLVSRSGTADEFDIVSSVSRAHAAEEQGAWLGYFEQPGLAVVTITVTEAGYLRRADGGLHLDADRVRSDIEALRAEPMGLVTSVPGRLVAGLVARRRAGLGPLAVVPCDNIAGNGAVVGRVVAELAELVDPELAAWTARSVSVVSTVVDRITPRTSHEDIRTVAEATGLDDQCPVVAEPFHEWVLSGSFPAGRPIWESTGATFTDDVTPYEHRKLWLLNGAHSLLAYAGSMRGHTTVAEAIADDTCRGWVHLWWTEAGGLLGQPDDEVDAYREALLERFQNDRIRHLLAQIAADGSQKLPVRILPVLSAERAAGRMPRGATRALAAWVCHLRGLGAPVVDSRAEEVVPLAQGPLGEAVRRVLDSLDGALCDDAEVVSTIVEQCEELAGSGPAEA